MSAAQDIVMAARAREARQLAARKPIDYEAMNRQFPKQKAALTRAVRSGSADRVVLACRKAVAEWNEIGAWPDDWAHWQRALDDALGFGRSVRLESL